MDDITHQIFRDMQLPQVQLIKLSDFEKDDLSLLRAKQNRTLIEYYFTCTPLLPIYIMNHTPDVDIITYLDADLYFFSSIEPIYQELGGRSVLIIGHRFPSTLKDREKYGRFNVGLLSFRNDNNGLTCLHWWRDRCLEWCYDRVEDGKFADQKYLDDWHDRFTGVVILQHKGAGLAPWNLANYIYTTKDATNVLVDGQPLIMYHCHGVKQTLWGIWDIDVSSYKTRVSNIVKQEVYLPYLKELNRNQQLLTNYNWELLCKERSIRKSINVQITIQNVCDISKYHVANLLNHYKKWVYGDFVWQL